jgi:hypothetical protein
MNGTVSQLALRSASIDEASSMKAFPGAPTSLSTPLPPFMRSAPPAADKVATAAATSDLVLLQHGR